MIRLAFCLALFTATPVLAQDNAEPALAFDPALVDACLDSAGERQAQDQQPAWESCIAAAAGPCLDGPDGSTTVGTSMCFSQEYDIWDAKLNEAYQALLSEAEATDKEMAELGSAAEKQVPHLRDMQRNWIALRDAACGYERSRWGGGTGGGPAATECMMRLTAQQFFWLQKYQKRD